MNSRVRQCGNFACLAMFLGLVPVRGAVPGAVPSVGAIFSASASLTSGVTSTTTLSCEIDDPSVIPGSVQLQILDESGNVEALAGTLHDDGLDGDEQAHDNIWTIRTALSGSFQGAVAVRVSAGFRGSLLRSVSTVALLNIHGASDDGSNFASARRTSGVLRISNLRARAQLAAASTILDYEVFADGNILTTQYANVTFANSIIRTSGVSLNEFEFPAHSGSNVVSDNGGLMTLVLSPAVSGFSGYFTHSQSLTITAFDASNTQIGTVTSVTSNNEALSGSAGSHPNELIQINVAGIAKITITGALAGTSFTMDDTTLGPPAAIVPPIIPPVQPPVFTATPTLSFGTIALGASISGNLSGSGTPPYTWTLDGSKLPAGLTLKPNGNISGTPTQAGSYGFSVLGTDQQGSNGTEYVTLSVLGITSASLPAASATLKYSQKITAAGGAVPYTFTATGLPLGLALDAGGNLTGTPLTAASSTVAFKVTDANGLSATTNLTLVVGPSPVLAIATGALSAGIPAAPYSQNLIATGGTSPYSWSVTTGSLPAGITLSPAGSLSGTTSSSGTFVFTVKVTDSINATATANLKLVVGLAITNASSLPAGVVGVIYSALTFSVAGGATPYSFVITSGSLPAGLNLTSAGSLGGIPTATGNSSFGVTVTDANGVTGTGTYQLQVLPFSADLLLSTSTLSFSIAQGAGTTPPAQVVQIQSPVAGTILLWSDSVTPPAPWLAVTPATGSTPGNLTVALTPQALRLASSVIPYQANVVVTCAPQSPCAGSSRIVSVTLLVTSAAPQLTSLDSRLAFVTLASAPQAGTQKLNLLNTGGGTVGITSVTADAGWVKIGAFPSSAAGGIPVAIDITADPGGLQAGYYRSIITITSSTGIITVPVTLQLAANPTLTLAPAGLQFQISAGGTAASGGSFLVDSSSASAVTWTASVPGGANWLTLATTTGSSSSTLPGTVNFSIDPVIAAGLSPQTYYGTIRVTSGTASNSPVDFGVVLTVSAATSPQSPQLAPAGLLFITTAAAAPAAQNVRLFSNSAASLPYQAAASTSDGSSAWLSVTPATGTASPSIAVQSPISVNASRLTPGVYFGGVSYAFAAGASRTVNVTLIVQPAASPVPGAARVSTEAAAPPCSNTLLASVQTGLPNNFSQTAGLPATLAVQVADNCGSSILTAQIVATFSNGDSPLPLFLANAVTGLYVGTWTPKNPAAQVTVTTSIYAPGLAPAVSQLNGAVTAGTVPYLAPGGTLNVVDGLVGAGLSGGTIVQIFGLNLASQTVSAPSLPLPAALSGTSVLIGGVAVPLYFVSPTQVNAQIPFELVPGRQYQVAVNVNGAVSTPDTIQAIATSPGLAVFNGILIAQHADASLVTKASPANPGEILVAYAVGLGATDNAVITGAASPLNPLARAQITPVMTLGGKPVLILYSGLTPGLAGLYQVNFQVPADAANGDLAVVFTQGGVQASSTILPVRN